MTSDSTTLTADEVRALTREDMPRLRGLGFSESVIEFLLLHRDFGGCRFDVQMQTLFPISSDEGETR